MPNKKAQLTIFIIIAIVLVGAVAGFFIFKDSLIGEKISADMKPIHTSFLSCLEENTLLGIDILQTQAGYISLPNFEPGSAYMPFSSQLDFLGNPIPYWYYVSGNNIQKEQIPTKKEIESQLEEFIEGKINNCVFDKYYEQGFEISQDEPKAEVNVKDNEVEVILNMGFTISKEEDSSFIKNHKVTVKSKLGKLYKSAVEIYNSEQKDLFLENYAVDTLRLYAPVDGVELTCSPMAWNADEIFDELKQAIETNTLSLKTKKDSSKKEYFAIDIPFEEEVRFINSKNWPSKFEVISDSNILIAEPIGSQAGLGILGFCYVPYHFVYNIGYSVLIQIQSGEEIFQFPVAVVLQNNKPREALDSNAGEIKSSELCKYKNTLMEVSSYDTKLNPIETYISYECLDTVCNIGKTENGLLSEKFPQCVNGYIIAKAEGFENAKYLQSTIESGSVEIILDKLYKINIELKLDGATYNNDAIINFVSDSSSKTIIYPKQKTIELSEDQYEVQIYIYRNSSIKLGESVQKQCIEVPKSGLSGLFGITQEKCFDIQIPAQIISTALSGGGTEKYYILENELENSNIIEINAQSLPTPSSIEQLQNNYLLFEDKGLDIQIK